MGREGEESSLQNGQECILDGRGRPASFISQGGGRERKKKKKEGGPHSSARMNKKKNNRELKKKENQTVEGETHPAYSPRSRRSIFIYLTRNGNSFLDTKNRPPAQGGKGKRFSFLLL